MDFTPTEEQIMLRDMLQRFVQERYCANEHRAYRAQPGGFSADNYTMLADLGVLGLPLSTEVGGFGGGLSDTCVMMEALGHGLVVEPVLSRIVVAARILDSSGFTASKSSWLGDIVAGRRAVAFAHRDQDTRMPATIDPAGRLIAAKSFALDAVNADALLITCRDETGATKLALVSARGEGVRVNAFRLVDGSMAADVVIDHVVIDQENIADCSHVQLKQLFTFAAVAACAETLGIMQRLLDDTVTYAKDRRQFGKPIGTFQAVQHRAARMFIAVEQSRSLVLKASLMAQDDIAAWQKAAKSCVRFVNDAALDIAHDAVQLHGGIGITDELAVSFGHRRLLVLRTLFEPDGAFPISRDEAE
jgi:alkylation response protein AidB-like acyl-CoA dehydrogenase